MSALAIYLKKQGYYVQGSDISENNLKSKLQKMDIPVFKNHKKENVTNIDVVVYNFAIKKTNEEYIEAKKQNLKLISRAELLKQISLEYKNVIAISGSHGKTSTTKMIYNCLCCANLKPTLHVGGVVEDGIGLIVGEKDFFVTEACEYHDSFLFLNPTIGVILNVEKEHLDYFKSYKNQKESFVKFAKNSKKVVCFDGKIIKEQIILTFGKKSSNIVAKNITIKNGKYCFDCYINNSFFETITLGAYGKYNITNALAVIGVCYLLNISKESIQCGLKMDLNISRRFETVKSDNGKVVIHDYAHHPTEIKNTLKTFESVCKNDKKLVVFQPHTYSRTKTLFEDFVKCLQQIEDLLIIKTYPAREKYDKTATGFALYKALKYRVNNVSYCASFDKAKKHILKYFKQGYNVILLGAGDIENLVNDIKNTPL